MSRIVGLMRFLWDFVVGDDWRIAAGVVLALGLTAGVADTSWSAWWILPAAVVLLLAASVWHGVPRRRG
jgi:ABC-type xylose transport system permease subunit